MLDKYLILPNYKDIRAARSYIGWTQTRLAEESGLNLSSITKIETGHQIPAMASLKAIAKVFLTEHIVFSPKGGFVVEDSKIELLEEENAFLELQDDMIKTCALTRNKVLYLGADDDKSSAEVRAKDMEMHNMGIEIKHLIGHKSKFILLEKESYRLIDPDFFLTEDVVVIYGNKVAFTIEKASTKKYKILVINDRDFSKQMEKYFYRLWKKGLKV